MTVIIGRIFHWEYYDYLTPAQTGINKKQSLPKQALLKI